MAEPFVGEVRMFGGNFAPVGWAFYNGQTMAISEYETLFNLIGTTYGGNGTTTFNLPNLQGRLCVGIGQGPGLSNYVIGQAAGAEEVTLTTATMPQHSHPMLATTTAATLGTPASNLTGAAPTGQHMYTSTGSPNPTKGNLNTQSCTNTGQSQSHPNLMPSLCVTFMIALYGIYPSQN